MIDQRKTPDADEPEPAESFDGLEPAESFDGLVSRLRDLIEARQPVTADARRFARALYSTYERYQHGMISPPTFRKHIDSLWNQAVAAGHGVEVIALLTRGEDLT